MAPQPVVAPHTTLRVSDKSVTVELRCRNAPCAGTVALVDVKTELGHSHYNLSAGQTGSVTVGLFPQALTLLAGAKGHAIDVTETITVTGGKAATTTLTLLN